MQEKESLDVNKNVTIWFFKRQGLPGVYLLIRRKDCDDNSLEYSFVNNSNEEVVINYTLLSDRGIRHDELTKRPLITCFEEYFYLFDVIAKFVKRHEVPFIISRISQFDDIDNLATCKGEE